MKTTHYTVLDGLRGVAALAVLAVHASLEFNLSHQWDHAALAVDFFFCLSGFVIAHAYDGAFAGRRIDLRTFALKRIVRLGPMILAGSALGGLMFFMSATNGARQPLWEVGVLTASSAVLLPTGIAFGLLAFPANPPLWSLFFEGVANAVYGLLGDYRPSGRVTLAAVAASGLALIAASFFGDGLRCLGFIHSYWLIGGLARVAFPFLVGVLICRLGLAEGRLRLPDVAVGVILAAVLMAPNVGPLWVYDLVAVLVAFPIIVTLGARAQPGAIARPIWKFLGEISYPLYAIHYPVFNAVTKVQNHALHLHSANQVALLATGVSILASWLAFRFYDVPVRAWLGARRRSLRPVLA